MLERIIAVGMEKSAWSCEIVREGWAGHYECLDMTEET